MEKDSIDDVNAQNKDTEEKMLARQQAKLRDYQKTFSTEQGQRVLNDLIASNFVMHPTFKSDPNVMMVREGQRICVLNIMAILKMDPSAIKEKIEEIHHEHTSNEPKPSGPSGRRARSGRKSSGGGGSGDESSS